MTITQFPSKRPWSTAVFLCYWTAVFVTLLDIHIKIITSKGPSIYYDYYVHAEGEGTGQMDARVHRGRGQTRVGRGRSGQNWFSCGRHKWM